MPLCICFPYSKNIFIRLSVTDQVRISPLMTLDQHFEFMVVYFTLDQTAIVSYLLHYIISVLRSDHNIHI